MKLQCAILLSLTVTANCALAESHVIVTPIVQPRFSLRTTNGLKVIASESTSEGAVVPTAAIYVKKKRRKVVRKRKRRTPKKSKPAVLPPTRIKLGGIYSPMRLLKMGYAVEMKRIPYIQLKNNEYAKAAAWRFVNGNEEFWEGVVLKQGDIVIKQRLPAPKQARVLSHRWTGGVKKGL